MNTICPCCGSPDTISYWSTKETKPEGSGAAQETYRFALAIMKVEYPNARICVDCEYVWWQDPQPPIDLSKLTIESAV